MLTLSREGGREGGKEGWTDCLLYLVLPWCIAPRFHVVGVLLIFIHDIGDVFLEGSKCFNYFKVQDGRPNKCAEMIANIGFLLFAAQ